MGKTLRVLREVLANSPWIYFFVLAAFREGILFATALLVGPGILLLGISLNNLYPEHIPTNVPT